MERAKLEQIISILMENPYASDEDIGLAVGLPGGYVNELILDYDLDGIAEERVDQRAESEYDESMDGDFDSAMASAGFGTDEDYGYIADNDYYD